MSGIPKKVGVSRKRFLPAILLFAGSAIAVPHAIAEQTVVARITGQGIYQCASRKTTDQSATGTGHNITESSGCSLFRATDTVKAQIGTRFGCSYDLEIPAAQQSVQVEYRWLFPRPGIWIASRGERVLTSSSFENHSAGSWAIRYVFDEPEELVLGVWRMEVVYQGSVLTTCIMNVVP